MLSKVRSALRRLFPKELAAYIPGRKLVAGVVCYGVAAAFGAGPDELVELPIVGEVTVEQAALALGVYLFPEAE